MKYHRKEMIRVACVLLTISALAWTLQVGMPHSVNALAHCSMIGMDPITTAASNEMRFGMNLPASIAIGWEAMLVAMMLPLLISQVYHVYVSSFAHRRVRAIVIFLFGYVSIWTPVGAFLITIEFFAKMITPHSYVPAMAAALLASAWQCSPIKQRSLNRCHSCKTLTPFGTAADFDALCFGVSHGIWCACSCWIWMLFTMLLPRGHLVAMSLVTILLFSERLERPKQPSWKPRGLDRVTRTILARTRLGLYACPTPTSL